MNNPSPKGVTAGDMDTLPSPSGQHTSMPHNVGAAHPLGPYAPRTVAPSMPHLHPSTAFGQPSPSGQYVGGVSGVKVPQSGTMAAGLPSAPPVGAFAPTPSGQYSHATNHDSSKNGGGMC